MCVPGGGLGSGNLYPDCTPHGAGALPDEKLGTVSWHSSMVGAGVLPSWVVKEFTETVPGKERQVG